MATVAAPAIQIEHSQDHLSGTPRAGFIDRWIYVFTAASIIAVVLTGFIPDSIRKVGLVESGQRPPFPLILHVHAVLMASFLVLMLTQTILVATGRVELHRRLGRVAFVLAPTLIVAGFLLVPTMYHYFWAVAHAAAPAEHAKLLHPFVWNIILLIQMRIGVMFAVLVTIGLMARKTNPGLHKRMMILAPAAALPAAIDRMDWLPPIIPGPLSADVYILLLLSPMIVWDIVRNRRVHSAYLIWLALLLPMLVFEQFAFATPWWHATAQRIMGV